MLSDWDNMRPDSLTLDHCSRVCKRWLHRSSKYLFYSVALTDYRQYNVETRLEPFLALARSSSRISSSVVILNSYFAPTEENVTGIFTTFPNLSSLLWNWNNDSGCTSNQDTALQNLDATLPRRSLTHLRVSAYTCCSVRFFAQLDHVCTLEFGRIWDRLLPWPETRHLRVSNLILDSYDIPAFWILVPYIAPDTIRKLVVQCQSAPWWQHLRMEPFNLWLPKICRKIEFLAICTDWDTFKDGAFASEFFSSRRYSPRTIWRQTRRF